MPPLVAADSGPPDRSASPVVLRTAGGWIAAADPVEVVAATGPEAFDAPRHVDARDGGPASCRYDLGRAVERVGTRIVDDLGLPDLLLARYEARAVTDRRGSRIEARTARGPGPPRSPAGGGPPGRGAPPRRPRARPAPLEPVARRVRSRGARRRRPDRSRRVLPGEPHAPTRVGRARVAVGAVRRHRAPPARPLRVAPRSSRCPTATTSRSCPASPERFLQLAGPRRRDPAVKGTGRDAARLVASEKDRAENVMIVDLARNDLGRVCEPGSITVPELCAPEHHPGLVHLVSSVRGTLRPDVGPAELLRATFPPASITGAPKPRVLQAIEDLEPVRRGVYCGAIGWLDTDRGVRRPLRRDPDLHRRRAAPRSSVSVVGSSPTPTLRPSGARPSSRRRACSRSRARTRLRSRSRRATADARLAERRAGRRRTRRASPPSTTGSSSATASSRRCASTAGRPSRGGAISTGSPCPRTASACPFPIATSCRAAAGELLAADGIVDGRLRITVTGGPSPLGSDRGTGPPTVMLAAAGIGPWPVPGAVVVVPWPRNERGATAGPEDRLVRGQRPCPGLRA